MAGEKLGAGHNNLFFSGNVPFKRIRNTRILHDRNLFGEKTAAMFVI